MLASTLVVARAALLGRYFQSRISASDASARAANRKAPEKTDKSSTLIPRPNLRDSHALDRDATALAFLILTRSALAVHLCQPRATSLNVSSYFGQYRATEASPFFVELSDCITGAFVQVCDPLLASCDLQSLLLTRLTS